MTEQRYRSDPVADESFDAGDTEALASRVALEYWERIRYFAARHLDDASAAEDVAQETMRVVIEALQKQKIRDVSAIGCFVFQTARNICLHAGRSRLRTANALARFSRDEATAESDNPVHALMGSEESERVRVALGAVVAEDQAILLLFFEEGLDADEVGQRLSISAGAARVRKHRALSRVEEALRRNDLKTSGTIG